MPKTNLVRTPIPASVLAEVKAALSDALAKLEPYLVHLTPDDRRSLAKVGEKGLSFVIKGGDYAAQFPALRPVFMDYDDFLIDLGVVTNLRPLLQMVESLQQGLDDTVTQAGSEAFTSMLTFYIHNREAAKAHAPHAQVVYDDLSERFPGRGSKKAASQ